MPGSDITVTPANSPYPIPGPTATFNKVTLEKGGFLQITEPTTVDITTLETQGT